MYPLAVFALALAALATSSPPTPPADKPAETAGDAELKALAQRVDELKGKVFRARARLLTLQEAVMAGDLPASARAVVVHQDEMGASFVLESVAFALDGAPVLTRTEAEGALDRARALPVFDGRLAAGDHQVSVRLHYRARGGAAGDGDGRRFLVESAHSFRVDPGKVTVLHVVGHEKGGPTAPLADRPAVRYRVEVKPEDASVAPASGGGGR